MRCFDGVEVRGLGEGTAVEGMISNEKDTEADADAEEEEEVEEKESSRTNDEAEEEDFCRRLEERPLRFGLGVVDDCCHDHVDLRASSLRMTQSSINK